MLAIFVSPGHIFIGEWFIEGKVVLSSIRFTSIALAISTFGITTAISQSDLSDYRSAAAAGDFILQTIYAREAELGIEGRLEIEANASKTRDGTSAAGEMLDRTASPDVVSVSANDEVLSYLWDVYQRSVTKRDAHGDFTWKDQAAARRMGMSVRDYVIGGMHPDFREQLYHAGLAMDRAGIRWTILSGFRDDYRQSIAAGFKAHVGHSFHGGTIATRGYGYGCAVDLASIDGLSNQDVWTWLATHAVEFGLHRPLPGPDPAHVQARDTWHQVAVALRHERATRDGAITAEDGKLIVPASNITPDAGDFEDRCARQRIPIQLSQNTIQRDGARPPTDYSDLSGSDRFRNRPMPTEEVGALHLRVGQPVAGTRATPRDKLTRMWVVQLAGGYSESVALGGFYRLQRKFSHVLGAYRPVIERAGETGYRWYRARVAMETRANAEKLCGSLRTAGGDCLVLPSR